MPDLNFQVEWDEAPGVSDPELSRTWGQLQILISGTPITKFYNTRTHSVRSGTYGSMLPLATWLLDRWWFLLSEGTPSGRIFEGGRRALESGDGELRDWLRRHNLLTAREGFALPDLSIFRDETGIQLRWVPDAGETLRPGRFLEEGRAVVSEREFVAAIDRLIESVAERLDESGIGMQLRAELATQLMRMSDANTFALRSGLAALGLDPDADLRDDPGLRDALLAGIPSLPGPLQRDVLEAGADELAHELVWVNQLRDQARSLGSSDRFAAGAPAGTHPIPHIAGYQRARATRAQLALPPSAPVPDLEARIATVFGPVRQLELDRHAGQVGALVTYGAQQTGVVVGARAGAEQARRFRLARALHHWLYAPGVSEGRLLTNSHAWSQRASRAFAAEFLAPADGIREHIEGAQNDETDVRSLAQAFRVSEQVIQFQIVNHDL